MKKSRKYTMRQSGGPAVSKPGSTSKPVTNTPETAGFLERLASDYITPYSYTTDVFGKDQVAEFNGLADKQQNPELMMRDKFESNRQDAWRTYLGLHPRGKSLIKTKTGYQLHPDLEEELLKDGTADKPTMVTGSQRHVSTEDRWVDQDTRANIMGNYTLAKGKDKQGHYIRYRDKWDLEPEIMGVKIPVGNFVGTPYEIGNKIYYDPKTNKRINRQQGGNAGSVIIEKNELAKDLDGNIVQVHKDAPSHDDPHLVTPEGIHKVQPGKGGVMVDNLESVLSDSQSQINAGDRPDNIKDRVIRIKANEANNIAKQLGLKLDVAGALSPTKLFTRLQSARDKQAKKYTLPDKYKGQTGKLFEDSQHINAVQQKSLPDDSALYDVLFAHQEAQKQMIPGYEEMDNQNLQQGGSTSCGSLAKYL